MRALSCAATASTCALPTRASGRRATSVCSGELPDVELRTGPFAAALLEDAAQVVVSPGTFGARAGRASRRVAAVCRSSATSSSSRERPRRRSPRSPARTARARSRRSSPSSRPRAGARRSPAATSASRRSTCSSGPYRTSTCSSCRASSSRPRTRSRRATATVLNVTPDHMDRYDAVDEYAAAKARIFDRCDVAVVNADDAVRARHAARGTAGPVVQPRARAARTTRCSRHRSRRWRGTASRCCRSRRCVCRAVHNAANALAALAMGEALALPHAAVARGAERRSPACRIVRSGSPMSRACVTSTTPRAPMSARRSPRSPACRGPLVVIAGGDGKSADFGDLRAAFRGKVRHVVLIGTRRAASRAALAGVVQHRARERPARRRACRAACRAAPATRCCCRRPARVSTCSATTRIAATCSPRPSGSSRDERGATRSPTRARRAGRGRSRSILDRRHGRRRCC